MELPSKQSAVPGDPPPPNPQLVPVIEQEHPRKSEILLQLLLDNNRELVHWRDRNWSAFRDTAAGLLGLAAIARVGGGDAPLPLSDASRLALVVAPFVLAVLATVYLLKNFERYQDRREIGARLETALQLYEGGAFLREQPLYPLRHAKPRASRRGTHQFILAIWILAGAVSVVLSNAPVTRRAEATRVAPAARTGGITPGAPNTQNNGVRR